MAVYLNDSGWTHLYKGLSVTAYPSTFACWFRPKNITETHPLVTYCKNSAKYDGNTISARTELTNDPLYAEVYGESTGFITSPVNGIVANTWQHAVGVFDDDYVLGYLNGNAGTPDTQVDLVEVTGIDLFQVGYYEMHTAHSAEIDIAEVSVWSRRLTAGEVASLAAGKSAACFPTDLEVYHKLIDNYTCEQGTANLIPYNTPQFIGGHPTIDYNCDRYGPKIQAV